MQDFGEAGFQAGAFASGEDEDSNVVIGHGQSIVHWTRGFDNVRIQRAYLGTRSMEIDSTEKLG
jgi:hypothetical protein